MTIDKTPYISPEQIELALHKVLEIIDFNWLMKEKNKRSSASGTINKEKVLFTKPQNLAAIKNGYHTQEMHPIAECILHAIQTLEDYKHKRPIFPSAKLLTRILSLRDIANSKNRIPGLEERLHKLKTAEWKPTMYELLTAISYSPIMNARLVPENNKKPVPDIILSTSPEVQVECKSRLKHERRTEKFITFWRRNHLSEIAKLLRKYKESFIIRVEVNNIDSFKKLPYGHVAKKLEKDLLREVNKKIFKEYKISIEVWDSNEVELLPNMQNITSGIWSHGWNFNEWNQWHYILPHGEMCIADDNFSLVKKYKQRCIICVRANELSDNAPQIINCIKDACKRQLSASSFGILHICLNSSHFGLGINQTPTQIKKNIEPQIIKAMGDYSRLWKVYVDISNNGGIFESEPPTSTRLIVQNNKVKIPLNFIDPAEFLIV